MQATSSFPKTLVLCSRISARESSLRLSTPASTTMRRYQHHHASRQSSSTFLAPRSRTRHKSTTTSLFHTRTHRRTIHASSIVQHSGIDRPEPGTGIKVTFEDSKGNLIRTVEANEGDDILAIAHEYDIDLEGACEGSIACSTCHIILPPHIYNALPEADDDENDMLDMAFGLTDTSRLGCQVKLTKEMGGMEVRLPSATRNMFVDGKKAVH
ncbi:2Fe-2S ferredoxin-type domain-containing protein [Cyathus striatus]|nr:2Fe-2S ferredoxin-type domain-containing protein [Cyathus striatus]